MPLPVTDVQILKGYLNGVMERADHHANEVDRSHWLWPERLFGGRMMAKIFR